MPAISITDLNNAKLDVEHIAALAMSPALTTTDRLGQVKKTVAGVFADMVDDAAAVDVSRIAAQALINADVAAVEARKVQALVVDVPDAINTLKAFNARGVFAGATAYALKDVYTSAGIAYVAVIAHVSTSVAADLAAGKVTVHQGATREDLAAPGGAGLLGHAGGTAALYLDVLRDATIAGAFGVNVAVQPNARSIARDGAGYWWLYAGDVAVDLATDTTANPAWKCLGLLSGQIPDSIENFGGALGNITAAVNLAIRSPYTGVTLKAGAYTYTGNLDVQRDDFVIRGAGVGVTTLTIGKLHFGIHKDSDYAAFGDNFPIYDATKRYFHTDWCSPATPGYPRYKNLGLDGVSIVSSATAVDLFVGFTRTDGVTANFDVSNTDAQVVTNGVVIRYCSDVTAPYIKSAGGAGVLYNIFWVWNFNVKAGRIIAGRASRPASDVRSFEIKHGVNVEIDYLEVDGVASLGYGSYKLDIGVMKVINGIPFLRSSQPCAFSDRYHIGHLIIDNPGGQGLSIERMRDVDIGTAEITAKYPLYFSVAKFTANSSRLSAASRTANGGTLTFAGDYDTMELLEGYQVGSEYREWEIAQGFKIGKLYATITDGGTLITTSAPSGISAVQFDGAGKLKRFGDVRQTNVDLPALRVNVPLGRRNRAAWEIQNLDIDVEVMAASASNATLFATATPIIKSKIKVLHHGTAPGLGAISLVRDSEVLLSSSVDTPRGEITGSSAINTKFDFRMNALNGRLLYLTSGAALSEGYKDVSVSGDVGVATAALGTIRSPVEFALNAATADAAWLVRTPIKFTGLALSVYDGTTPDVWTPAIARHYGTIPTGLTFNVGASEFDVSTPKGRYIEPYATNRAPQHFGQIVRDVAAGTLYIGTSLTAPYWTALY